MRLHQRQLDHVFSELFKTNTAIFICEDWQRGRGRWREEGRKGGREKGCRERVEMEKMEERERDSGREELKE